MPKATDHLPAIDASPPPRQLTDQEYGRDWLSHVEAGRIGQPSKISAARKIAIAHNELALCGRMY